MKTWTITINAENEKNALELLNLLIKSFKLAVSLNKPMEILYASKENGESIKCIKDENI
jgi:hypothetical protein